MSSVFFGAVLSCGVPIVIRQRLLIRCYARSMMANTNALIAQVYSAFNRRNIDEALSLMSENVDWPKASEGGRVIGKEEIRAYWTRQWAEFDPPRGTNRSD